MSPNPAATPLQTTLSKIAIVLAVVALAAGCSKQSAATGPGADAGAVAPPPDGGGAVDSGSSDAGSLDAGPADAGRSDAGPSDAGPSDAGAADAGAADAGLPVEFPDGGLPPAAGTVTLQVDLTHPGKAVTLDQVGINHRWQNNGYGAWTDAGPSQELVDEVKQAGIGVVRYPGGTMENLFFFENSVGANRGCQVFATLAQDPDGGWSFQPADQGPTLYGPSEHMQFVEAAGATANIHVPFMNNNTTSAANFVEYLNGAQGSNPNGGIDWANVRANDGHPAPYGIKHFEIGNEPFYPNEKYWLSSTIATAQNQYMFGEHQLVQTRQPLGKNCDFGTPATSDGTPDQTARIWYPPAQNVTVFVGGTAWTRAATLADAGPNDALYTVNLTSGIVRFGDGVNGKIPPNGDALEVTYTLDHPGFVDLAAAMKAVDPSIDVCAAWGRPGFVQNMAGTHYDCVVTHPYTFVTTPANTADELYDTVMQGEETQGSDLVDLVNAVKTYADPGTYVAVTEAGALGSDQPTVQFWQSTQMHAIYMASFMTRVLQLDIPFAATGDLTGAMRATFSSLDGVHFTPSAHARMLEAYSALIRHGGKTVPVTVTNNLAEGPTGSTYPAVIAAATQDSDGYVNVYAVNRALNDRVTLKVSVPGYSGNGDGEAWRIESVSGSPYDYNSRSNPDAIMLTKSLVTSAANHRYTLPPHSVVWLRLSP